MKNLRLPHNEQNSQKEHQLCGKVGKLLNPVGSGAVIHFPRENGHGSHADSAGDEEDERRQTYDSTDHSGPVNGACVDNEGQKQKTEACRHQKAELAVKPEMINIC